MDELGSVLSLIFSYVKIFRSKHRYTTDIAIYKSANYQNSAISARLINDKYYFLLNLDLKINFTHSNIKRTSPETQE